MYSCNITTNITRDIIGINGHQTGNEHPIFVVGKDAENKLYEDTLPKLMLTAGTAGSGRSLFLETFTLDLANRYTPEELKIILVDPKRVQFSNFFDLPHLMCPIITHMEDAVFALDWLINEQARRITLLVESKTRYTEQYNELHKENKIPHIVLISDEFAELMVTSPVFVEKSVVRLAQLTANMGIHVVLSTQRPSEDIITPLVKANATTTVAFNLCNTEDSIEYIGIPGAQELKGKGELLYVVGNIKPIRLQAEYKSQDEIYEAVNKLAKKYEREYNSDLINHIFRKTAKTWDYTEEPDPLYEIAKKIVLEEKSGSVHLLSTRLQIGYARAARLADKLKENGLI